MNILDRQSTLGQPEPTLLDLLHRPGGSRIHVHDYSALNVPSLREAKRNSCSLRAERALVMAQCGDVVLLNRPADPHFLDFLSELNLGVAPSAIIAPTEFPEPLATLATDRNFATRVADRTAEHLPAGVEPRITTYYSAAALENFCVALEHRLGERVTVEGGSRESAELANSKDRTRSLAQRLGIPTASGEIITANGNQAASDAVLNAVQTQLMAAEAVIIRAVWSASGADIHIARTPLDRHAVSEWLERRSHIRAYLVETLLPLTASPNFQLWIGDDGVANITGVSGQRLRDNGLHCGNQYPYQTPSLASLQGAVLEIAVELVRRGYRGPLGVDMMEYPDSNNGSPAIAFAETNGRMNASTYAFALHEGINRQRRFLGQELISAWVSHTDTPVRSCCFAELRELLGELVYTHGKSGGVVPFNTGLLSHGMVDLLTVADSVEDALALESEVLARLTVRS